VSPAGRGLAVAIAFGCLSLLLLSAWLQPSPSGVGTHVGLGLQRCQWLATTGLPCPGCGMTTSFAWFARGNAPAALWVQPMGATIAFLDAAGFWLAIYVFATGKPIYRLLRRLPAEYYLILLPAWAIVAWGWKMYIYTHGHDGWR
jgi:hypothetical protein